jgi:dihydroorotate dehydrogenase (fumarate)
MTTSALLKRGTIAIQQILTGMEEWMVAHEYESVQQMRGSMSQGAVTDPAAFERANYMKVLNSFNPN